MFKLCVFAVYSMEVIFSRIGAFMMCKLLRIMTFVVLSDNTLLSIDSSSSFYLLRIPPSFASVVDRSRRSLKAPARWVTSPQLLLWGSN